MFVQGENYSDGTFFGNGQRDDESVQSKVPFQGRTREEESHFDDEAEFDARFFDAAAA